MHRFQLTDYEEYSIHRTTMGFIVHGDLCNGQASRRDIIEQCLLNIFGQEYGAEDLGCLRQRSHSSSYCAQTLHFLDVCRQSM